MKKLLIMITILWLSNSIKAQVTYFNYLDYSVQWRYLYSGWTGFWFEDKYSTVYIDGDTLINSNYYYKVYRLEKTISYYSTPPNVSYYLRSPFFAREDNTKKFYYYDFQSNSDKIWYDFQKVLNASIGDTMQGTEYPNVCGVTSINMAGLGTRILKQVSSYSPTEDGIVEGIGSVGFVCAIGVEGNEKLVCFNKQNDRAHFNTFNNAISCDSFPIPDYISGVNPYQKRSNVKVYPNPSDGLFLFEEVTKGDLIQIIDITGKVIFQTVTDTDYASIDVKKQARGVYFYKIVTANKNTILHGKIVIQ